ncbi:MAG: glycosyltransferase family A protein [Planctomycetota bacterium]|jgi:glycosyltransferase involved in cell wall biosynthesis
MDRPTVSVVVPVYNRAALLPRAFRSVLAQTVEDWELIVVDDGSVDDTPEMVRHWDSEFEGRLRYVRQYNSGSSAARNQGIELARGRFIAFLDSDDEYYPDKLERQLSLFTRRPELGMVYSDFSAMDESGKMIERAFDNNCSMARMVPAVEVAPGMYVCRGSLFAVLIRQYFIATIVGMVRRDVLGRSLRFAEDQWYAEEWLFYLEVARRCACGFIDAPLALHHHERGSVTRTDKYRNSVGAYRIARAIERAFPGLTTRERNSLGNELVRTARQLGYDAIRRNQPGAALLMFREALKRNLCWRTLREYLSVLATSILNGQGSASYAPGQFDLYDSAMVAGSARAGDDS